MHGRQIGASTVTVVGVGAALAGGIAPIAFALATIAGFGMLHGISDLALVPRRYRAGVLLCYLALTGLMLLLWRAAPIVALATFLLMSAMHFGCDDAPARRPAERICRGLLMVAAPAVIHLDAVQSIVAALAIGRTEAVAIATLLRMAGVAGLTILPFALAERRRDRIDGNGLAAVALAAALLLPPLVGFAIAFVLLHASPRLVLRLHATGERGIVAHLQAHWWMAAGAASVIVLAILGASYTASAPLAALFGGVSALALPHMLVPAYCQAHIR